MANRLLDQLLGGEIVTFDQFMAATPQERYAYLTDNQYTRNGTASGARAAAAALRNITADPGQIQMALQGSGLDPAFANATGGELGGIIAAQEQDDASGDFLLDKGWTIPLAMAGAGFASAGGFGAGAGMSEGAAWGAGLEGSADLAAMENAVGWGSASGGATAGGGMNWWNALPDDLGYDFIPGDPLTNPLSGIPDDLGWDFPVNTPDLSGIPDDIGNDFIPGEILEPTKDPFQWMKYPANSVGDYLKYINPLKGLLGGSGGNASGGPTIGRSGSGIDTAIASAPALAAIMYARNQGPFDTSRLTSTYDQFQPDALAYEYDQNTAKGRDALTSSLTNRGVMGSSFGNNDITNFNTSRDLGRRSLVNQGLVARGDIAKTLLDAQVKERGLKNQLYGSALYSLGNIFGGKK
jgi:hypothetical protein